MVSDKYLETTYPSPHETTEISPGMLYVPDTGARNQLLETGRYVSIEDFHLAADAINAAKGTSTYTFGRLAYIFVERFGDLGGSDDIDAQLFYGALNRYNTAWLEGHLLLETQKVQELSEDIERGEKIASISSKSHEIISVLLRDDLSLVEYPTVDN